MLNGRAQRALQLLARALAPFALICLATVSLACRAHPTEFVHVAPEPSNSAWWLRAEYNPFGTSVRGIPIRRLSSEWCFANEFTPKLIPSEYMREVSPELSFSVESRFGHGRMKTALVGAFETCAHQKGLFLLIIERHRGTSIVRYLKAFPVQQSLAALRITPDDTLELWWCSHCDNYEELAWDKKHKRYDWVTDD